MLKAFKIAAVCVSNIHEDTTREFLQSLNACLCEHGWRVFVYTTASDLYQKSQSNQGEMAVFDLIHLQYVDAVIIFGDKILDSDVIDSICSRVGEKDIPILTINSRRDGCCNLGFDHEGGFTDIVRHLVHAHGIRKFHFMAGIRNNAFSDSRKAVMYRVLAEEGIPFDESMVSYGDFWSIPTRIATEKLIAEGRLPEAIVCANDTMAGTVCSVLAKHGYRVPEDLLVTGFDGIDIIHYCVPKLTSCICSAGALAQKAADLLLHAGTTPLPDTVLIRPELLPSESCGCVPTAPIDLVDYVSPLNNQFNRYRNEEAKLNEISAHILQCSTIEEVKVQLRDNIFYDMCCLLKKECINNACNPLRIHSSTPFGDELYVLVNTDRAPESPLLPAQEIIPYLDEVLSRRCPLIFIALHYVEIPLGYLCFHFNNTDRQNYLKISQTAAMLNNAIGGYRSMQYQYHLQDMLEDMYKYDSLTGLLNRNGFLRRYRQTIQNRQIPRTLVLCDLDGLKYINDTFSHHEGDNAISVVGDALTDACGEGICCRYGGDELIAVLEGIHDPGRIRERILGYLAKYNQGSGKPYSISASIGVCHSEDLDFEQMFAEADRLMYKDKVGKPHRRDVN